MKKLFHFPFFLFGFYIFGSSYSGKISKTSAVQWRMLCTSNNLELCLPNRGYEKRGEDCKEERLIHWRKAK